MRLGRSRWTWTVNASMPFTPGRLRRQRYRCCWCTAGRAPCSSSRKSSSRYATRGGTAVTRPTHSTWCARPFPGYGFSGPTVGPGWNVRRISAAFALLMQRLGYHRYGAAGGDWGAIITSDLVRSGAGTGVCGLYLTMPLGEPPEESDDPEAGLSDQRASGLTRLDHAPSRRDGHPPPAEHHPSAHHGVRHE